MRTESGRLAEQQQREKPEQRRIGDAIFYFTALARLTANRLCATRASPRWWLSPWRWRLRAANRRPFAEIAQNHFGGARGSQMDVGGFESHGAQQPGFVAFLGHGRQLDARAIGRQTAHDPAAAQAHEGIDGADRPVQRLLIVDAFGDLCRRRPRRTPREPAPWLRAPLARRGTVAIAT